MHGTGDVVRLQFIVRLVRLVAAVLFLALELKLVRPRNDDVLDVLHARVPCDLLLRAICLLDLRVHLLLAVLHENCRIRIRLGHLLLALLQSHEHVVRQDDGLVLALDVVAVLSREHIHLALIHPELADVRLEKEDVRALHARVENLRRRQLVALASPHDLRAPQNPRELILTRDIQHQRPVFIRLLVDLFARPHEFDVVQIHPNRLPHLDHVFPNFLNLL